MRPRTPGNKSEDDTGIESGFESPLFQDASQEIKNINEPSFGFGRLMVIYSMNEAHTGPGSYSSNPAIQETER